MPGVQTNDRPERFSLFLRTAFYDRILENNNAWTSSINLARAQAAAAGNQPPTNDHLGETPFNIVSRANNGHGITVQHSRGNTSFRLIGDSQESRNIAIAALRLLSDLNRETPVLEGEPRQSHYQLTFDLHIENIDDLQIMLRLAAEAEIPLSRYFLNNAAIDPAIIAQAQREIAAEVQTPAQAQGQAQDHAQAQQAQAQAQVQQAQNLALAGAREWAELEQSNPGRRAQPR